MSAMIFSILAELDLEEIADYIESAPDWFSFLV